MSPGVAAWIGVGVGVLVYNILAPEGHTLSEQVDLWIEGHETEVRIAVGIVARHLTNDIPERLDPLAWMFFAARHVLRAALRRRIEVGKA